MLLTNIIYMYIYVYIYITIIYHNIPLYGTCFHGPFWLSLAVASEVEVRIESVDVDSGKMSLSMKQPE